jgi:hypothetical protein
MMGNDSLDPTLFVTDTSEKLVLLIVISQLVENVDLLGLRSRVCNVLPKETTGSRHVENSLWKWDCRKTRETV